MSEIKNGTVTLVDLQKINAMLDMKNDIAKFYANKPPDKTKDGVYNW